MKKIILLLLIAASVSFSACKKEKKADIKKTQSYEEIIEKRSTWYIYDKIHKYSDSNNQLVVNDSTHYPVPTGTRYVFKDDKLTIKEANIETVYNYSFSIADGKNYISIAPEANPDQTEKYEILSADSKLMSWQQPKTNITYGDKTGVSGTYKINFHCPCPE
jgi:hypothetical protein